jgi:hypothetical protein
MWLRIKQQIPGMHTHMNQKLRGEKNFTWFAAICAFITAITTVAIHNIDITVANFEESVLLYKNKKYLFLHWLILFHCLMVLCSMLGMALIIEKTSRALAVLGFICFCLFVFSEWERTLNTIWYFNGLRKEYTLANDENIKQLLGFEIRHRLSQANVYFLLFTIGFSLGNLSYGLAIVKTKGIDQLLGTGLLLWFCCTCCSFTYDFMPAKGLGNIVDICNKYYQPLIRLLIAYWLFTKTRVLKLQPDKVAL